MHRFHATIERAGSAVNAWCFVTVPTDVVRALGPTRRITGTIMNEAFDGALLPRGGGTKRVLVTRELRDALKIQPGDEIEVALEADGRARAVTMPAELTAALESRPEIARIFAGLSSSHQREYTDWIGKAKKPATRAARVERAIEMIVARKHAR